MSDLKVERKQNDLKKLIEIFKHINELKTDVTHSKLIQILINIGELSGGISFNNQDAESIRNKYGYDQRVQVEGMTGTKLKYNEEGIDFKKLYHFKHTLSTLNDSEKALIFNESGKVKLIINELLHLQIKIAQVLYAENKRASDVDLETQIKSLKSVYDPKIHQVLNICKLSGQLYEQMALKTIHKEFSSFDDIDLSNSEDLYYFGRIFTITGELFHEINDGKTLEINTELKNAFKNLNNTRDLLIHQHKQVEEYRERKKEMEECIMNIKMNLLKIIIRNDEKNIFHINSEDLENATSLRRYSEKFNKIIKNRSNVATNGIIIKLKSIIKAIIVLINSLKFLNFHDRDKPWKTFSINYQKLKSPSAKEPEPYSEENVEKLIEELKTYCSEIEEKFIKESETKSNETLIKLCNLMIPLANTLKSHSSHNPDIVRIIIKNDEENNLIIINNDFGSEFYLKIDSEYLSQINKSQYTVRAEITKSINNLINLIIFLTKNLKSQNDDYKSWKLLSIYYQKIHNPLAKNPEPYCKENMEKLMKGLETYYEEISTKLNKEQENNDQVGLKKLMKNLKSLDFIKTLSKNDKETIIKFGDELKTKREQEAADRKKKNDDENKNNKKMILRSKIQNILEKINVEMEYLKKIEQHEIKNKKYEYVMDHIVAIIGQYQRDLDEAYHQLLKLGDHFISPRPTGVAYESSCSSKTARSSELVHDVFNLNRKSLSHRIKNDILPSWRDSKSIFIIYKHEFDINLPKSIRACYALGWNYYRLNMYNEAIKYCEQCLKLIKNNKIEYSLFNYLILKNDNINCIHFNTNTTLKSDNINDLYLHVILILSHSYYRIDDNEKLYKLLIVIYKQIESIQINNINNLCNHCYTFIYYTCLYITEYLFNKQDTNYEEILKICHQLIQLNNSETRYKIDLVQLYIELHKYQEANDLIKIILNDSNLDLMGKCYVLYQKHEVLLKYSNDIKCMNEIKEILLELNCLKENEFLLKELYGDGYKTIDYTSIIVNIGLINKFIELEQKQINYDLNIKLKLIEVENRINELMNYNLFNRQLLTLFIDDALYKLVIVYHDIIFKTNLINCENDFIEIFDKAKIYLNKINNSSDKYEGVLWLAQACGCYVIKLLVSDTEDEQQSIKYLKQGIDLLNQYKFNRNNIKYKELNFNLLSMLSVKYSELGDNYLSYNKRNEALQNYNESRDYLKQIELYDSNLEFNEKYEVYNTLGECYEKIGTILKDFELLQQALSYYDKITELINKEIEELNKETNRNDEIIKLLIEKNTHDINKENMLVECYDEKMGILKKDFEIALSYYNKNIESLNEQIEQLNKATNKNDEIIKLIIQKNDNELCKENCSQILINIVKSTVNLWFHLRNLAQNLFIISNWKTINQILN